MRPIAVVIGLAVMVIGIVAGGFFFNAGSKMDDAGSSMYDTGLDLTFLRLKSCIQEIQAVVLSEAGLDDAERCPSFWTRAPSWSR